MHLKAVYELLADQTLGVGFVVNGAVHGRFHIRCCEAVAPAIKQGKVEADHVVTGIAHLVDHLWVLALVEHGRDHLVVELLGIELERLCGSVHVADELFHLAVEARMVVALPPP